jgi:pilus assembly protein Flp/PilA
MLTFKDNKGQGLVEYALILVLVAVVVIVILALLGPAIGGVFSNVIQSI